VRRPDVGIAGDAAGDRGDGAAVRRCSTGDDVPERSAWKSQISGWQERYRWTYQPSEDGDLLAAVRVERRDNAR
jgi:hypothetical protein